MHRFFFLFLLFVSPLFGGSLTLINDSPFTLNALIISADGTSLFSTEVPPRKTKKWNSSEDTFAPSTHSQTPYTVIWKCKSGKEYGIWVNVAQGSTVTAQGSTGDKICRPPKKKAKAAQKK